MSNESMGSPTNGPNATSLLLCPLQLCPADAEGSASRRLDYAWRLMCWWVRVRLGESDLLVAFNFSPAVLGRVPLSNARQRG